MPITPLPTPVPTRSDPTNFSARADAFLGALPTFATEANALQTDVNAKQTAAGVSETNAASSASAAAASSAAAAAVTGVTVWVSGTTYSEGNARYDPVDFLTYRRTTNGAGTTRPGLDPANWLAISGNVTTGSTQTITGAKTFDAPLNTSDVIVAGDLTVNGSAYTPALQPNFSATPVFDASSSNVFELAALTANITSMTINNPQIGQSLSIRFVQDGTGSRTVVLPVNAKVSGSINTTPSSVSWLVMTYSGRATRWEGNWMRVPL